MAELAASHPDCQVLMAWPGTGDVPDFTLRGNIMNVFKGGQQMSLGTIPKSVYQPSVHNSFGHIYDPSSVAYGSPPGTGVALGSSIAQQYKKFDNIYDSESEEEDVEVESGGCAGCARCEGRNRKPWETHGYDEGEDESEEMKRMHASNTAHGLHTPAGLASLFAGNNPMMSPDMVPAMQEAVASMFAGNENLNLGEVFSSIATHGAIRSAGRAAPSGGHSRGTGGGNSNGKTSAASSGGNAGAASSNGFNFAKALETAKASVVGDATPSNDNQSGELLRTPFFEEIWVTWRSVMPQG